MDRLSVLKGIADYWRKVRSGELPAPGPNEIGVTICALGDAVFRIAELEEQKAMWVSVAKELGSKCDRLEAKLTTPVRLSCETHPRCRTQHAKDVRAAGFVVEGGEQ